MGSVRDRLSERRRQTESVAQWGYSSPVESQGDELFYIEGDTLMAVSVETEPSLRLGDPQPLFSGEPIGLQFEVFDRPDFPNYNVGLDGQRFVAVQVAPVESGRATHIVVVQNWFEEFRPEN